MANDIGAILNSPWFDRGLAVVLVFYLLRGMHTDIAALTAAIIRLDSNFRSGTALQTTRMTEIRTTNLKISETLGAIASTMARYTSGDQHGPKDRLPRSD